MSIIGDHFGDELIAAGLGRAVATYGGDGQIVYADTATAEEIAAVGTILAAHKPERGPILKEIAELERAQMLPRVARDRLLASDEEKFTPEQLANDPGYQRLKALDEKVAYLRSLL